MATQVVKVQTPAGELVLHPPVIPGCGRLGLLHEITRACPGANWTFLDAIGVVWKHRRN